MTRMFVFGLGVLSAVHLGAAPIDSKVIHHYTEIGLGYTYVHEFFADEPGHGVVAHASIDLHNVLLSVSATSIYGDFDSDLWGAAGAVGYAIRLWENHVNVIPRVGISYSEASVDTPFGTFEGDSTVLTPGITASYAFCNWFSIYAGYTYVRDIDFDEDLDAHTFAVGTRLALAERVGLDLGVGFAEGAGFTGASAAVSFHF